VIAAEEGAPADFRVHDPGASLNRTLWYRLEGLHEDETMVAEGPFPVTYRAAFRLRQNYPNPFNPSTRIRFTVPQDSPVRLVVYDLAGRRVRTLVDEDLIANHYEIDWDGRDSRERQVANGVYLYRLVAGDHQATRKMMLLK
jgi:hypothetical protein